MKHLNQFLIVWIAASVAFPVSIIQTVAAAQSVSDTPELRLIEGLTGLSGLSAKSDYEKQALSEDVQILVQSYYSDPEFRPELATQNLKSAANLMGTGGVEFDRALDQTNQEMAQAFAKSEGRAISDEEMQTLQGRIIDVFRNLQLRTGAQWESKGPKCTVMKVLQVASIVIGFGIPLVGMTIGPKTSDDPGFGTLAAIWGVGVVAFLVLNIGGLGDCE
jgi:hypothetical protein